jgi:hypothetical protein
MCLYALLVNYSSLGEGRMRKSDVLKWIALMCLCALVLVTPLVLADSSTESFTVYTDKQQYLVGDTISIYVQATAIDPNSTITVTDVVVYDPTNVSVAEWHGLSIVLNDTTTSVLVGTTTAASEGSYTVSANATGCLWLLCAIWHFICFLRPPPNVVPEAPAGTVMAGVSMAAALLAFIGVPRFRRKRYAPHDKLCQKSRL